MFRNIVHSGDIISFLKFFSVFFNLIQLKFIRSKNINRQKLCSGLHPISRTVSLCETEEYNILKISGMTGIGKSGMEGIAKVKKGTPFQELLSQNFYYN